MNGLVLEDPERRGGRAQCYTDFAVLGRGQQDKGQQGLQLSAALRGKWGALDSASEGVCERAPGDLREVHSVTNSPFQGSLLRGPLRFSWRDPPMSGWHVCRKKLARNIFSRRESSFERGGQTVKKRSSITRLFFFTVYVPYKP